MPKPYKQGKKKRKKAMFSFYLRAFSLKSFSLVSELINFKEQNAISSSKSCVFCIKRRFLIGVAMIR